MPDAHRVAEVDEGVDAWELVAFEDAADERFGGAGVLAGLGAEAAEGSAPGSDVRVVGRLRQAAGAQLRLGGGELGLALWVARSVAQARGDEDE